MRTAVFGRRSLRLAPLAILGLSAGCSGTPADHAGREQSKRSQSAVVGAAVIIDWSMPDVFGSNFDRDGYLDLSAMAPADPAQSPVVGDLLRPSAWKVVLDGCGSTPAQSYDWDVALPSGNQHISGGSSCRSPLQVPAQGDYFVTLTLGFDDGTSASASQWITVKNYLVVSMGDSLASGEGDPNADGSGNPHFTDSTPPVWSDTRCHRSVWSGHARAALALEQSDPHSSVTFLSVACSGAGIDVGLLHPYAGQQPPANAANLHSQIDQVFNTVCSSAGAPPGAPPGCTPIDILLLTVGANDAGFGTVVRTCATPFQTCSADTGFTAGIDAKVAGLPSLYDRLDDGIHKQLDVKRIYFGEYVDPTHDELGNSCADMVFAGAVTDQFAAAGAVGVTDGDINQQEVVWARDHVLRPVNAAALAAAQRHDWQYIGGIADAFKTHGYCAIDTGTPAAPAGSYCFSHSCEHWIERYDESVRSELLPDGTMHPNDTGYSIISEFILAALMADTTQPRAVVSSAALPTGAIALFGRGMDDAIWVQPFDGAVWQGWQSLGASMSSTPSAVVAQNQPFVFAVDKSGRLLGNSWTPGVGSGAWQPLGATMVTFLRVPFVNTSFPVITPAPSLIGPPTAVARPDGGIDVLSRAADGGLLHLFVSVSPDGTLSAGSWEATQAPNYLGNPSAVAGGPNRLDVVAAALDGTLLHGWENAPPGGQSDWQWEDKGWPGRATPISGSPKVVSWGPSRLDVLAVGMDDKALWHLWYDGGWSDWDSKGNTLRSDPDAVTWGPGHLDIFARGPGLDVWQLTWDDSFGWAPWFQTWLSAASGVTADSPAPGSVDFYYQVPGGGVVSDANQQGQLSWSSLGGVLY